MAGEAALRIRGETAYPATVASVRVRVAGLAPFLRSQGIQLEFLPTLTAEQYALIARDGAMARKAMVLAAGVPALARQQAREGLLLVHRLRSLLPVPRVDPPRRVDVYDFDDALFLPSPTKLNPRFQWVKQDARRCVAYLRRARMVFAGNSYLAARAREYANRVEVVPSCVDPTAQPTRSHEAVEVATVGWIGSPTTSTYLSTVLPVFEALNSAGVRAKLLVVGADTGVRAPWIEHRPWTLRSESELLASFDVGIMPLHDDPWAQGKCGYKLLQYFSAGVPAVASPIGVNPSLIGATRGLLASTPGEWRRALESLLGDLPERRARGRAAREFVEREFSYQRWAPEVATLLRQLAG